MLSPIETVLFDFDYTLADSSQGIIECVNYALNCLGLPMAPAAEIRSTIGLSLPAILIRLAGSQQAQHAEEFRRLFIERADEVMVSQTRLYAPVPAMVGQLREKGVSLGIVSTKFRHRIEAVLRREKLLEAFDAIVGGEDVAEHKPDPEGLLTAIQKLQSLPSQAIYVGDSVTDAETAQRAGVAFVAVLSGVTARENFESYEVHHILGNLGELPGLISNSKNQRHQGESSC